MASSPPQPRLVASSLIDYLASETVAYYASQEIVPPGAALDAIGFRVGYQLAERHAAGRPRLGDPLDVVKYVCKDLWAAVFGKQIDNLRTNHRGTFVLRDAAFSRLTRFAVVDGHAAAAAAAAPPSPASQPPPPPAGGAAATATPAPAPGPPPPPRPASAPAAARDHLRLPAAMVRGALAALGLEAGVSAEAAAPPAVDFTVVLRPPPPVVGAAAAAAAAAPPPATPAVGSAGGVDAAGRPPTAAA